jgi:hypothetical protein
MSRSYRLCGSLVFAAALLAVPTASFAGVFVGVGFNAGIGVSVHFAPPPIPVYVQPPCVVVDAIWTPGYWAYGPYGYFWVPGTWVAAPQPGFLWTPGYWGYNGGVYAWHGGYWGPHIGFYGGVNYGFGYGGVGYVGGGWYGDHFRYNTAVTNVNQTRITNVYVNKTVVTNYVGSTFSRVSYNGGPGGVARRPNAQELAYRSEQHVPATAIQRQHVASASQNRNFLASINHGVPVHAAVASPLNRYNRPAGFAPPTSQDRSNAATRTTRAAWSRFDSAPGAQRLTTYGATRTYHAPTAYHAPTVHHAPTAYRAPNKNHALHPYHATSAYHAPDTYHAAGAHRGSAATHMAHSAHGGSNHRPDHHAGNEH